MRLELENLLLQPDSCDGERISGPRWTDPSRWSRGPRKCHRRGSPPRLTSLPGTRTWAPAWRLFSGLPDRTGGDEREYSITLYTMLCYNYTEIIHWSPLTSQSAVTQSVLLLCSQHLHRSVSWNFTALILNHQCPGLRSNSILLSSPVDWNTKYISFSPPALPPQLHWVLLSKFSGHFLSWHGLVPLDSLKAHSNNYFRIRIFLRQNSISERKSINHQLIHTFHSSSRAGYIKPKS